ncbi:hypothetical protein [Alteromonas sp. M12]|uniref:hypothetical protein n=1 Tax=Alteromonas sp. M12 TaxID=3135644 RepID=UPI00319E9408
MLPKYWKDFIDSAEIEKKEIHIPASADLSEIDDEGVDIYIFNDAMSEDEANNCYPGIGVKSSGYIPVAGCQSGTGDPYFININEGDGGSFYRIYHDEVFDENYDVKRAIDKVLNSYEELRKFKIT